MTVIRLPQGSNLPAKVDGRSPASSARASAFFQAALAETGAARPPAAATPVAAQMQTQGRAQLRPAPAQPFVQSQDPPQKILRPGSLVNILV
ncbi:MAG: hypothetical protein JWP92_737 [Caulobacter sp.]|nr:hypothetical protein [Caulobacter sp.]